MRPWIRHLAPRLILLLTIALVVVEGTFGVVNVRIAERNRINQAVQDADRLSRSICAATWHAMRADRKDDAYAVMDSLADRSQIQAIRLLDPEGELVFATQGSEQAAPVERRITETPQVPNGDLVGLSAADRATILDDHGSGRRLALLTAIPNEPACSTAACHVHAPDESVLGVLEVTSDLSGVDTDLRGLSRRAVLMSIIHMVVFGILILLFTRHFVGRPIRKLIEGTRSVAAADLDRPIEVESGTELGELATAFNTMTGRLRETREELQRFTQSLEEQVESRSRELSAAREKLIRTDRLASLGQLAASVTHEINNPIGGILNYSVLLQRILREDGIPSDRVEEFRGYLHRISTETERVGRIVNDLLSFSRQSSPRRASTHLDGLVERTLGLLAHKLEQDGIRPVLEAHSALPPLMADRTQLEQVAVNLIMNAAEAMPEGGTITIRTRYDPVGDQVVLEVRDYGAGIPPDIRARIFDPFFTTKPEGKGVGLGLSVVYGIVESHGGEIDVQPAVGGGTVFTVRLPRHIEAPEGNGETA